MTEHKKMVVLMLEQNKELFDNFKEIHDEYAMNPGEWQKLLNQYGAEILDVIRGYERKLLVKMGSGKYGQFSAKVSEKFWDEVRKIYPKIDFVGITMT